MLGFFFFFYNRHTVVSIECLKGWMFEWLNGGGKSQLLLYSPARVGHYRVPQTGTPLALQAALHAIQRQTTGTDQCQCRPSSIIGTTHCKFRVCCVRPSRALSCARSATRPHAAGHRYNMQNIQQYSRSVKSSKGMRTASALFLRTDTLASHTHPALACSIFVYTWYTAGINTLFSET